MRTCTFRLLPAFSEHVLQFVENNIGCTSQKKIGSITNQNEDIFDNVCHHTAVALQRALNVSVYNKEHICTSSKTFIIAAYWSTVWIYLIFYKKNKHIHVIVVYRKKKMDGTHSLFDTSGYEGA
jgi:hypothetical protein